MVVEEEEVVVVELLGLQVFAQKKTVVVACEVMLMRLVKVKLEEGQLEMASVKTFPRHYYLSEGQHHLCFHLHEKILSTELFYTAPLLLPGSVTLVVGSKIKTDGQVAEKMPMTYMVH